MRYKPDTVDIYELLCEKKQKAINKLALYFIKHEPIYDYSFDFLIYDIIFYSYSKVTQSDLNCAYKVLRFFSKEDLKYKKIFMRQIQENKTYLSAEKTRIKIPKTFDREALINLIQTGV